MAGRNPGHFVSGIFGAISGDVLSGKAGTANESLYDTEGSRLPRRFGFLQRHLIAAVYGFSDSQFVSKILH
jgi:hypothetical protein